MQHDALPPVGRVVVQGHVPHDGHGIRDVDIGDERAVVESVGADLVDAFRNGDGAGERGRALDQRPAGPVRQEAAGACQGGVIFGDAEGRDGKPRETVERLRQPGADRQFESLSRAKFPRLRKKLR